MTQAERDNIDLWEIIYQLNVPEERQRSEGGLISKQTTINPERHMLSGLSSHFMLFNPQLDPR